jgi:hypothetical protein
LLQNSAVCKTKFGAVESADRACPDFNPQARTDEGTCFRADAKPTANVGANVRPGCMGGDK